MNAAEAVRAFEERLRCETITPEIVNMRVNKLGVPVGLTYERDKSTLTRVFLIFPAGENAIAKYQIEKLRLSDAN